MKEAFFQKEKAGGRGLDTVSHFFLTDCDARDIPSRRASPGETSVKEKEGNIIPDIQSEVCIVLCPDGFAPQCSFIGCMLALYLAAANMSVGLIETTTRLPHTFFLSGGYKNLDAVFWEAGLDLPEFFGVVARFRKANDIVLINAAASVLLKTTGFSELVERCLVPTTVQPRELLSAYGAIKSASKSWSMAEIELVVIKQQSTDNAAGAAAVLERMARRFLPCSVRFVGAVPLTEDMEASEAFSLTPSPQVLTDATAASVMEIARHLIVSGESRKKRKPHVEKCL